MRLLKCPRCVSHFKLEPVRDNNFMKPSVNKEEHMLYPFLQKAHCCELLIGLVDNEKHKA